MNKLKKIFADKTGSMSGNLILWLLGVPLPLIILISLLRGCR